MMQGVMFVRTILWVGLTLGAIWLGLQGVIVLTKATEGVGMIGLACLAGIIARIIQASRSS